MDFVRESVVLFKESNSPYTRQTKNGVLDDCPRPRRQLENKKIVALALALKKSGLGFGLGHRPGLATERSSLGDLWITSAAALLLNIYESRGEFWHFILNEIYFGSQLALIIRKRIVILGRAPGGVCLEKFDRLSQQIVLLLLLASKTTGCFVTP